MSLELVGTHKTIIAGKFPLKVYRSRHWPPDEDQPIEKYIYHFGFPKEIVEPPCLLLETSPFWGDEHWKEEDGFWIWRLTVTGNTGDKPPYKILQKHLDSMLESYNKVIKFLKKGR